MKLPYYCSHILAYPKSWIKRNRFLWKCLSPLHPLVECWGSYRANNIRNKSASLCFASEKDVAALSDGRVFSGYRLGSYELGPGNHAYGMASVLKQYVGLPEAYPIKVSLSHTVSIRSVFVNDSSYDYHVPTCLAWGEYEKKSLLESGIFDRVVVIGAPYLYAENFFSDEYVATEKERLGKNLLFFPAHSNDWEQSNFDLKESVSLLEPYKERFDSIRVCLYWKDVQRGLAREYAQHGFECVTAGHAMDTNFYRRMKGILAISDAAVTNAIGTHVVLCVASKKPIVMINQDVTAQKLKYIPPELEPENSKNFPAYQALIQLLKNNEELVLSEEICESIEPFLGTRQMKTHEELRTIFAEAEKLFYEKKCQYHYLKFR